MSFSDLLFSFEGRASRRHYWLVSLLLGVLQLMQGAIIMGMDATQDNLVANIAFMLASLALSVAMVWMSFAIMVKRYHDHGKSGWWWLIIFIPIIGLIWQFIELGFLAGNEGSNLYGPPA